MTIFCDCTGRFVSDRVGNPKCLLKLLCGGSYYIFQFQILSLSATTTTTRNLTSAGISFNPNVPPGFIFDGSHVGNTSNSTNSSDQANTTFKTTRETQRTMITSGRPMRTNDTFSSVTLPTQGHVNISTQRQSVTSQSIQTVIKTSSSPSTRNQVTPRLTTPKLDKYTSDTLNTTEGTNASLSNSTVTAPYSQTFSVMLEITNVPNVTTVSTPTPVAITSEMTQNNTSKYTSFTSDITTKQENLSTVTKAVPQRPTTDPFSDNRPWNLRRSTHRPHGNVNGIGRRTTTELIYDDYDKGDTFWPVAMALTIGVPTIIVFAVTITVLYRRRMNKPRGLLGIYGTDYQSM